MLTEQEREAVHADGSRAPVKVQTGWAVLVPCANDDWEIEVLPTREKAIECGEFYWGFGYGCETNARNQEESKR